MIKIVNPKIQIEEFDADYIIRKIERAARTCYKTEGRKAPVGQLLDKRLLKTSDRANFWVAKKEGNIDNKLLKTVLANVHSSVLEHCSISVIIRTCRSMTHQLVRHRIGASYSQTSTRYVNYSKEKFGNKVAMLKPYFYKNKEQYDIWEKSVGSSAKDYFDLLRVATTEEAREVLPNSTATEIFVTYNIQAWRHFFDLRTSQRAHFEIRRISMALLIEFSKSMPVLFGDIMARYNNSMDHFPGIEDVEIEYIKI